MVASQASVTSGRPLEQSEKTATHLELWQKSVQTRPNDIALISRHQTPETFRWVGSTYQDAEYVKWTYADLDRGARRLATALNRLTHVERRPVATLLRTSAEWCLFYWAAAYLHSPLVPINPATAPRSEEMSHMFALTKPAVVICGDSDLASQLEQSLGEKALSDIPVRVLAERTNDKTTATWTQLADVMSGDTTPPDTPEVLHSDDTTMILFTSGTTSLPKPCHLSSFMCLNAAMGAMESRRIDHSHKFVQHLPNFHSYGVGWSLGFWCVGGTVILPSEAFEAQASLECFSLFGATHMSLVPTTAQAILAHPYFGKADLSTLVTVDVSGAGVLPSVINACWQSFKVPSYSSYGMTESPNTIIWPDNGESVVRNGEVLAGSCVRGTTVKICEPNTRNVVARGQIGELHSGGPQVIHGYADPNVKSDNFYVDENGTQWIVTGDQAVMEEDGMVRISGRYKDMIIRGGENISPASIEDYLRRRPGVAAAEVIGIPDEMAGEVPIAIITTKPGENVNASELKNDTTKDLGSAFSPKMVLHLQNDLKMDDFPKTASGKVRKVELRGTVREYVKKLETSGVDKSAPTVESLIQIWQRISGTDTLDGDTIIDSFADSLMMMQLSGTVKKQLGRDITVENFKRCETLQDQANLIDATPDLASKIAAAQKPQRQGPPSLDDIPHLKGDSFAYDSTKALVSSTMSKVGLRWNDVEDVMPLPDWDAIFCHRARPSSWNLRFSWHAPVSRARLEAAVMESLKYHPTFRAMGVIDDEDRTLLITVRDSMEWLRVAMTSGHQVQTPDDLKTLLLEHPILDNASMPGPLVRIHIASVESDGTSGLVFVGSHATNDMSMTKLWLDDVANLLTGESAPVPHALFKDYANAFWAHRDGAEAEKGINYWATKHAGISTTPESSFWPPQRSAEWFKGVDSGWSRWDGGRARKGERCISQDEKRRAQKGVRKMVNVQDLTRLKSEHGVPVFMLVKAAICLMNIAKTGGKEAIFGTINAARTWPFASDYSGLEMEQYSGNPLDISGCTTEYVLDRVPVGQSKNVVQFMQNVTKDEEQNSSFAHTPFFRVVDRLRDPLSAADTRTFADRERDAEAILPLIRRQSFNWLPQPPNAQANPKGLRFLEMLTRMDNGLTITGFLMDNKKSVALSFAWDAEHMSYREAEKAIGQLAEFVDVLGKSENWNLSVGEVLRL
ncbi:acetyl-CoA synthetase-like protein [Hortaea werneckii]|nr:acetyl-CoA synthetase-like protein [Hortaea werneckii]KAI7317634.1 acetyl-CoA synthetase-like protein [Hortaea werneckii]